MRLSRFMFGLPLLAALACVAVLNFAAPSISVSDGVTAYRSTHPPIEFGALMLVEPAQAVIAADEPLMRSSADSHVVAYVIANQPRSNWRLAVEGYSHIDPHILAA